MAGAASTGRIVVAVDFGTTFSGVAAAFSASPESPDEIQVVKSWPGGNNTTTEKVPSEIAYGDQVGQPRWGLHIRGEEERLRCMKLMLDPSQELPNYVSQSDLKAQLLRKGKNAQSVVADYLSQLWKHAKTVLERRWPFLSTTKLEVILTVPAVWSDAAKDATLTAAKRAGMGSNITLISEPEAAAVYTMKSMQPSELRPGDNYIVCDAGGGTVDLIAFNIKQVSPLRVEESAEGDGDCCGAAILNMRFEEHVRTTIGAEKFDAIRARKSRAWQTALKYFDDYVKRNFNPEDMTEQFFVPFPVNDGEAPGVENGYLALSSAQVWAIFEPVVNSIIRLIESQIHRLETQRKSISGIILVGGFGQSECLFKKLQARFGYLGPPPPYPGLPAATQANRQAFQILQPHHAWTAVVRGGVLRGLEGTEIVQSRISRRHYGVRVWEKFIEGVHPGSCRVYDSLQEEFKADDRMRWFINKGQSCDSDEAIILPFYRTIAKKQSKIVHESLIVCDKNDAPDGCDEGKTRTLCTFKVDLGKIPNHHWKWERSPSGQKPYQRISYKLGMQIKSGSLHFDLRVDGVVYGSVAAKFE